MKQRITIPLILMLIIAIFAGRSIYRREELARLNVEPIVTKALSNESVKNYIAYATTTTNSDKHEIYSTIYHRGDTEKIEHAGHPNKLIWTMTKGNHSYTFLEKQNKLLVSDTSSLLSDKDIKELLLKNYKIDAVGKGVVADQHVCLC